MRFGDLAAEDEAYAGASRLGGAHLLADLLLYASDVI